MELHGKTISEHTTYVPEPQLVEEAVVVIITSVKPEGLEDHVGAILVYSTLLITNHH